MKLSYLKVAALALIATVCVVVSITPDAAFAATDHASTFVLSAGDTFLHYVAPSLVAMRANLELLERQAKEKKAEIKDDTPDADVRRIEAEHTEILEQIRAQREEIATAESDGEPAGDPAAEPQNAPANETGDIDGRVQRAIATERTRSAEINSLCRRHGLPDTFAAQHIDSGSDIPTVRAAVLEELANRSNREATFPHVEFGGQDEVANRRAGMAVAITARLARAAGQRNVQVPEIGRAWAERELIEIAAECIGYRGHMRTARQVTEVFERAFHTTSDFPGIFTDALNNRLLARYEAAAPSYRRFASRYVTPDFKPTNVIRAGDFPALQEVNESGEIKAGTFGESKEAVQTKAYGVQLRITRVMLVNDQLMAIDQVLSSAGTRVSDWENALVFAALLSGSGAGPVLKTDNKRVFHADHGNLAGSGAAITVASVGVGRAAMAKQTTLDGIKANFMPVTLLTGPDKITEAEQLVATITPAKGSDAVPESIRRLIPVGDANIPGNAWYLFADPEIAPVMVYSYLEGFEGPRLTSEDGFDVQGVKVKLEHDFGAGAIDFRGGYRDPGA